MYTYIFLYKTLRLERNYIRFQCLFVCLLIISFLAIVRVKKARNK